MEQSDFQRMAAAYSKARFKDVVPPASGIPGSFSVVTAWNPDGNVLSAADNESLSQILLERLDSLGLSGFPVTGHDPDSHHEEQGFGIPCDRDTAIALGKEFSQIAVFVIVSGTVHLVSCGEGGETADLGPWSEMCD